MSVLMELSRIFIREMTDMQIIELTEIGGDRTFPIVIGLAEAWAIERRLKGIEIRRPQTHDLLASTITHLNGRLKQIVINDLVDGTFYAKLIIIQNGEEIEVDSRPSDAIALGVAEDVPIYVAEHVLAQTQTDISDDPPDDEDLDLDWD
ncbi:MAG: bifunctional nuclease family protein [Phycisphaerales bacterium]|nr:bifunctional nuclease family protein [Phycisphaerae bacterium]NNF45095.1 bifunctional nuclease family protein [Phycisphaerales bacterium]NNM25137.1 bifunctional nuclease family protein [Phycisphaerales bacterium]